MYTNYAYGVENGSAGAAGSNYNLFVTGTSDYSGATGFMLKSDTTQSAAGNKGTRISQDNNDNSYLDFRTNATDGAQNLAFRLQDDANPTSFSNMLVLNKDSITSTMVYGANVTGRIKASQYYIGQADARVPTSAGVYLGMDQNTVGYFKVNKGAGVGGFTFNTYNANGTLAQNNMNMNALGTVQVPYYSTVTTDSADSETTAMAVFDATGNLVRSYQQNSRFRSVETRLDTLEGETISQVPTKVNEIIGRLNTLKLWNTSIQNISIPNPPIPYNPSPSTTSSVKVVMGLAVPSATASASAFKTTFVSTVASTIGIASSRIVVVSVAASGSKSKITFTINPDATNSSNVSPALAANTIISYTSNNVAPLYTSLQTAFSGTAIVDTTFTPTQSASAFVSALPEVSQVVANLPSNSGYITIAVSGNYGYSQTGGDLRQFPLTGTGSSVEANSNMYGGNLDSGIRIINSYVWSFTSSNIFSGTIDPGTAALGSNYSNANGNINGATWTGNGSSGKAFDVLGTVIFVAGSNIVASFDTNGKGNIGRTTSSYFDNASNHTVYIPSDGQNTLYSNIAVDANYFYVVDGGANNQIKQYSYTLGVTNSAAFVKVLATAPSAVSCMQSRNGYVYYSCSKENITGACGLYRVSIATGTVQTIVTYSNNILWKFDFSDDSSTIYYILQSSSSYINNPPLYSVTNL